MKKILLSVILALFSMTMVNAELKYELVRAWGSTGEAHGEFKSPHGLAVDPEGNVYVADTGNHRIQKFDSKGKFMAWLGSCKYSSYTGMHGIGSDHEPEEGSRAGEFKYPAAVAADAEGNIYVADTNNYRIQKFDAEGNFITEWGSQGRGDGEFYQPSGVAVDSAGRVYVSDLGRNSEGLDAGVQVFNPDQAFMARGEGSFRPSAVAVDAAGNVYVTDVSLDRILKFRLKL